jgi:hypothetical protein
MRMIALAVALALLGPKAAALSVGGVTISHGYAVFGELKYGPGFAHFDYVNPDAPKGGSYSYASQGVTFDSLNQIALLGTIPPSVMFMTDTLMKQSRDEPASYYCLVCKDDDLACRPVVGRVRDRSARAVRRRDAGHPRGRDLLGQPRQGPVAARRSPAWSRP